LYTIFLLSKKKSVITDSAFSSAHLSGMFLSELAPFPYMGRLSQRHKAESLDCSGWNRRCRLWFISI